MKIKVFAALFKTILIVVFVLQVEALWASNQSQIPPNIIFIMADDLGYADLGSYGQKQIKTPNIDRFAKEGLQFTQCYSGSTVCAPSRSTLLTGMHTGHTTVRGNRSKSWGARLLGGKGNVPLKSEDVTIAEVLKMAGYVTGMTGKWGLGETNTTGEPNKQGFDEWFGYLNHARAHNHYPEYLWYNQKKVILAGNQNGKKEQLSHEMFTDFALDFIEKNHKKTFFLYLPYTYPHGKYEISDTDPYTEMLWDKDEKVYAAMITSLDRDVGRIITLLKKLGIDHDTVVFFTSDNGPAMLSEERFDSSGPLRGTKRSLYEGGIRVPFLVRWPGKIKAGTKSDFPCYFPDVMPTLAHIAGVKTPDNIDGVSILPYILDHNKDYPNRFLYWEFFRCCNQGRFQQAVRWGNWKAIRMKPGRRLELYDLSDDIGENSNVAQNHPETITRIEDYIKTARTDSPYWPVPKSNSQIP